MLLAGATAVAGGALIIGTQPLFAFGLLEPLPPNLVWRVETDHIPRRRNWSRDQLTVNRLAGDLLPPMKPTYFKSPAEFQKWLAANHAKAKELLVGFHKRDSGTPSMTWPESVDEALCFGWIDGVRKRVDEARYTIRFSPRRKRSNWSLINVNRVKELIAQKRMRPAGLAAFEARETKKTGIYAYENRPTELEEAFAKTFRRDKAAWAFFQAQPPSYRKLANWYIASAQKEETRQKRLAKLIADSAAGKRI